MSDFDSLWQIALLLLPLLLLQLGLLALGVWDWTGRQHFRYLNRWVWLAIIVLVSILGPAVYLLLEREEG